MHVARPGKAAAAAALSSMVAAIAIAGPLAGTALAGRPALAPPIVLAAVTSPTASSSQSFSWSTTATESFTCAVDGAKAVACGSGKTGSYSAAGPFTGGTHNFVVRGKLATGKSRATSASVSWVVDRTPPQAPTVTQVPTPTRNTTANVNFSDGDLSAVSFQCSVD